MYRLYKDILNRLGEPKWYDDLGTPRYDDFSPNDCGIYDSWVLYFEIACQACGMRFTVAASLDDHKSLNYSPDIPEDMFRKRIEEWFAVKDDPKWAFSQLYGAWGDAPWHGPDGVSDSHQCSGTTMCHDTIRPISLWRCDMGEWTQVPILEEWIAGEER